MITVPAPSQCAGPSRGGRPGGSGAGHDPLLEGAWPRPTTPARGSRHLCPDGYPCSSRHPVASAQLEQYSLRARPWRRCSAGAWSRCVPGVETRWRLPAPDRRQPTHAVTPNLSLARPSGFLTIYLSALVLVNTRSRTAPPPRGFAEGIGRFAQIGLFVMLGLLASPARLLRAGLASPGHRRPAHAHRTTRRGARSHPAAADLAANEPVTTSGAAG